MKDMNNEQRTHNVTDKAAELTRMVCKLKHGEMSEECFDKLEALINEIYSDELKLISIIDEFESNGVKPKRTQIEIPRFMMMKGA